MRAIAPWLAGALVLLALGIWLEAPLLFIAALCLVWVATLEAMKR